jgi:glycosyltransferase involved in cell wall biosynthesis
MDGLAGHHELATVFRALPRVPGAELVVADRSRARAPVPAQASRELACLAASLGVGDRVGFLGGVSRDALPALLRSADVFIAAAGYDPTGMVPLKAMACGTPVIVTGFGGQADAVVDGTTGVLVPPGHPALLAHRIRRLLTDPMRLMAFGAAAADRARSRFSWDRIAGETLAVYGRVLNGRAAVAPGPRCSRTVVPGPQADGRTMD